MNDFGHDIVARNVTMLLIALIVDNFGEAMDSIIHIWHSALICKFDLSILQQQIRPLIESVCGKIKDKTLSNLLGKIWTFCTSSLRFVLEQSCDNLLSYMNIPPALTAERENEIRNAVTFAEPRKDCRDFFFNLLLVRLQGITTRETRSYYHLALHALTFNQICGELTVLTSKQSTDLRTHRTLFQTADTWPLHDNACPLNSWSLREIESSPGGPVSADLYGKLYCIR